MAATNINRVVITGNLTRDPEMRATTSGFPICSLRIACNTRRKDGDQWVDKPNYFDVTVFGKQAENVNQYLEKGRPVAIDGRLEWREWTDKDTQKSRQAVEIVADSVQFLGSRDGGGEGNGSRFTPASTDVPADTTDFDSAPVGGAPADPPSEQPADDIPF